MDHDRLFKELLTTFFWEFLELFAEDLVPYLERDSLVFLDKEVFTDVTAGERHEVDLVARGRFAGQDAFFLVHVEHQAQPQSHFPASMFRYFARLHESHGLPVYPIALLSYPTGRTEPNRYVVAFPQKIVLTFDYQSIVLHQLDWRDYLRRQNPVASALMTRMRIAPPERPRVKLECLRLLARLRLDPARTRLLSGFIDSYLRLSQEEQTRFVEDMDEVPEAEREPVMEIVTSWMEEGLERGRAEGLVIGRAEGLVEGLALALEARFGPAGAALITRLPQATPAQLQALKQSLLLVPSLVDLEALVAPDLNTTD